MTSLYTSLEKCKIASRKVALLSTEQKNKILYSLSEELITNSEYIIQENSKDIEAMEKNPLKDRLLLNAERIQSIAQEVKNVAALPDSIGEVLSSPHPASSIRLEKIRVPFGVVAMIYESRPNVTIDAFVLAFKSGNAVVLKGGKEAKYSNKAFGECIHRVLEKINLKDAALILWDSSREESMQLMQAKGFVDVLIPRGGKGLIAAIVQNATIPIIETGASVVHTFVDESADFDMATDIIINEKTRRVSVCNALDTLLIHKSIADTFLPIISKKLIEKNVKIHLESEKEIDFSKEWLDYDITIKIVKDIDEAIQHIHRYSLGHSESIVTENIENAERFLQEVDAACVYHNASTAFSDGAQFGFGAEIGISTQKLHARGPFALEGLTTYKWKIRGNGEIRE